VKAGEKRLLAASLNSLVQMFHCLAKFLLAQIYEKVEMLVLP